MSEATPRRSDAASTAGYTAVREAVGVAIRDDLAQIRLSGRDPVKMLHGLITNDLAGAPPGRGIYAAMLTAKGRTLADLRAFTLARPDGTEVLVSLSRTALAGSIEHFRRFVPPLYARWKDVSSEIGVIGVYGPRSRELLARVLDVRSLPDEEDDFLEAEWHLSTTGEEPTVHSVVAVCTRYAGGEDGFDIFIPSAALPALREELLRQGGELGALPLDSHALETLRIEAGRPSYGRELGPDVIPTEAFESTGLMSRAISFTKGCYTGQEVIVRIAHRGHVNRRLTGLLLGDAALPEPDTPLFTDQSAKQVGRITSSARSPLMRQTIALSYVRREVETGAIVRLGEPGGETAQVSPLPFRPGGDP